MTSSLLQSGTAPSIVRRPHLRARPGFTLVELMIVTAILSMLAMLAVPQIMKAREKAMVAAARTDLRRALQAIEMFRVLNHGAMPDSVQQLEAVDFHESSEHIVCRFEKVAAAGIIPEHVIVQIRHRGTTHGVTSEYPIWEARIEELDLGPCTSVRGT